MNTCGGMRARCGGGSGFSQRVANPVRAELSPILVSRMIQNARYLNISRVTLEKPATNVCVAILKLFREHAMSAGGNILI